MKKFYTVRHAFKRSCIEILPNKKFEGDFLHYFLSTEIPSTKIRLSDDIVFHIQACKKELDLISVHRCMTTHYYSKEFMDILNEYTDMSDRSYKINLPDATKEYYAIYNLKKYRLINRKEIELYPDQLDKWPPLRFVFGKRDLGPVFSVATTAAIIVSEEIMKAVKKAKLTNIRFEETFGYTPEEALEWARENPEYADDFADKQWFKKLLEK